MNDTRSNVLAAALAMALPTCSATAQLPTESWSLQTPFTTTGGLLGNDPLTGAFLRAGGTSSSFRPMPYTWVRIDGRWHRRTIDTPSELLGITVCATDSIRGRLVALGRTSAGGATTLTYDGERWEIHATHPLLAPRSGHAMAFDGARGRVVLFGGRSTAAGSVLADTWEWDGAQWLLRQPGATPPARYEHRLAFDTVRGRTVLFGGRTGSVGTQLGDTWEWDGSFWIPRPAMQAPSARYLHGMVYDAQRQRVVMAGGTNLLLTNAQDAWEWDGSTWTQTISSTTPSSGLLQPTELVYDARLGKTLLQSVATEELYEYTGNTWTRTPSVPPARNAGTMTFDPVRSEALLFGGTIGSSRTFDDTWLWRDGRWLMVSSSASPGARSLHAMAFAPNRSEIVLFGGYSYSGTQGQQYLGDVWAWDGTAWTQRPTTGGPTPRSGSVLAYHAPTQQLVLFGGRDATTYFDETWLWDGWAWTQAAPTQSPSPRAQACGVSRPSDVLLFGGTSSVNSQWTYFGDTWNWNGSDWSLLQTSQAPSARSSAAMTYDADRDRVLLLGGVAHPTQIVTEDTWVFDGTDWAILPGAATPHVRNGAMLTYDAATRRSLLFGGQDYSNLNDLWALDAAPLASAFGSGCTGTFGTPTLTTAPGRSPTLGGTLAANLGNLPHSFALVAMGFSDTASGTTQLPLALAPYGMPGCSLLVAPDAVALALGSQGNATWQLSIPFVTALAGLQFYLQAFALDPAANAAGATVSNGLAYRVGG
jgi:hypothetical protein